MEHILITSKLLKVCQNLLILLEVQIAPDKYN